nr:unnamed protein product [Digitaria exilis]
MTEANKTATGIPYLNFNIWIVCLTSTLPIQSLFPYLYFMIRDLKIAKQEQDIGFYAGFVGASYFLARTFSSVPWGIFADMYGRKPCIVISILAVIVFNTLFGLSTSYWMAIVTRGLLGLLCGILGPIKAYATEVCRKEHQALGISLVTSSRAIALVVGPAIGGFLAQPAEKYPNLFSKESIFGRFPYFLPSFVISILAAGSCIACIWLPETLHFHDDEKVEAIDELEAQVADLNLQGGKSQESSDTSTKNLLKNWQLMSAIIIYCIFCLHDTAYIENITVPLDIAANMHMSDHNTFSKYHLQTFSLWAVSSREFRGLSLTSQDVGTVLAVSAATPNALVVFRTDHLPVPHSSSAASRRDLSVSAGPRRPHCRSISRSISHSTTRSHADIPVVDDSPGSLAHLALDLFSGGAGVSRKGAPARLLLVLLSVELGSDLGCPDAQSACDAVVLMAPGAGAAVQVKAAAAAAAAEPKPVVLFNPAWRIEMVFNVLSIILLIAYPFMVNLQETELKVLINVSSLLKNVFSATITTACNILQNTAVTQEQRGVANGISVTLMSLFKGVAPAAAGILFSWAQKHMTGLLLPGDQILFLMINMVSVIGLLLTFKPFFNMSSALRRS